MVELTHQTLTWSCQLSKQSGISSQYSSRKIKVHQRYVFARATQSTSHLVDRAANGGLAGADMRMFQKTDSKINIVGIDDHELTGLDVVTVAALFDTQKGPVIGIVHEYAHCGKGRSIHEFTSWFTPFFFPDFGGGGKSHCHGSLWKK